MEIFNQYCRKGILLLIFLFMLEIFFNTNYRIYGDGMEYLGMAVSTVNHMSFELTPADKSTIEEILVNGKLNGSFANQFSGYFPTPTGTLYAWHYGAYSLLCSIGYYVLSKLDYNVLGMFTLINCILMFFLAWYILYRTSYDNSRKIVLLLLSFINPVIFYIPLSHAEVFIFVFFMIGLLELLEKRYTLACLYIAISSLQSSVVGIIPPMIVVYMIYKKTNYVQVLKAGISSLVIFLPSVFYWEHFHVLSLISSKGAFNVHIFSINKMWNLFFDLNFGFVVYVPLLMIFLLLACWKRYKIAWGCLFLLIVFAFVFTGEGNWNPGMVYIHRYCIWIMPLMIIGALKYFSGKDQKFVSKRLLIYLLTTGIIVIPLMRNCVQGKYEGNSLVFSPLANMVIRYIPQFYNPPAEVFIERATHKEYSNNIFGEVILNDNNGNMRKKIVFDNLIKNYQYENGKINFLSEGKLNEEAISKTYYPYVNVNDIFKTNMSNCLLSGWYDLEENKRRWINEQATVLFMNKNVKKDNIDLEIQLSSNMRDKRYEIYWNKELIFSGIASKNIKNLKTNCVLLQGENSLKFVSIDGVDIPKQVGISDDSRPLGIMIEKVILK